MDEAGMDVIIRLEVEKDEILDGSLVERTIPELVE
jgi:hypothetical protein